MTPIFVTEHAEDRIIERVHPHRIVRQWFIRRLEQERRRRRCPDWGHVFVRRGKTFWIAVVKDGQLVTVIPRNQGCGRI